MNLGTKALNVEAYFDSINPSLLTETLSLSSNRRSFQRRRLFATRTSLLSWMERYSPTQKDLLVRREGPLRAQQAVCPGKKVLCNRQQAIHSGEKVYFICKVAFEAGRRSTSSGRYPSFLDGSIWFSRAELSLLKTRSISTGGELIQSGENAYFKLKPCLLSRTERIVGISNRRSVQVG